MKRMLLLAIVMVAGCKKPATEAPPSNGGGEFDERQACSVDADCVPVEIECCDHCNGGTVVGIHRDHAADVRRTYAGPEECAEVACTLMACVEQPTGICRQGICGVSVGGREDVSALPPP